MKNIKDTVWDVASIVGMLALLFSGYKYYESAKKNEINNWQRIVIFQIIEDTGGASFDNIKLSYLQFAQQLDSFELPKSEIQDGALRRLLLNLLREKTVVLDLDNKYKVMRIRMPQSESEEYKMALSMIERKKNLFKVSNKNRGLFYAISVLLTKSPGFYTISSLYQEIKQENFDIDYTEFFNSIKQLVNEGYLSENAGKLEMIMPNKSLKQDK